VGFNSPVGGEMPIRFYKSPLFQVIRLAGAREGLAGVSPAGGHACLPADYFSLAPGLIQAAGERI
jgi:hypothetical protein